MTGARIAACLLLAGPAAAQSTGAISGRIVDAQTARPVAGAVVIATGPALPGSETARTDPAGEFEIGLLPPGAYALNVHADAHQPASQEGLVVHAGRTLRLNLAIVSEAWTSAPLRFGDRVSSLPATGTGMGGVVSRDQLELIPYGRDARTYEQAAISVPGALGDPMGLQISGSPSTGTRYRVDGLDVTDPATNRQGRRLLQQFIEEVAVDTGGFDATHGRLAGGLVQATTRSGGNDVHGSAFFDWMPLEVPRRMLRYNLAGGADLGGPIARDVLWFYGAFAPVLAANRSPGTVDTDYEYLGKLTWRPASGQLLSLAALNDDVVLRYLGHLFADAAQVEGVAGWHRGGGDASTLQARLQISHLVELFGRHRPAYGVEGARDEVGDASRWYGAAFVQDAWSPGGDVVLHGGLRAEHDQQADHTDLLPRAGIAWDFSGRGVSRAYVFFGRFIESSPVGVLQRTRESDVSAGVESQVLRDLVAGVDYVHKQFGGSADGRTSYDGATVFVAKPFSASSLLTASYTRSTLRGSSSVSANAPNVFKLDAAYAYEWDPRTTFSMGTSFRAIEASPWQTTIDVRLSVIRTLSSPYLLAFNVDALNLLDREAGGTPPLAIRFGGRLSF
jgi:Carboxypeptidase regulatory-like domain/TonB dependent receptor